MGLRFKKPAMCKQYYFCITIALHYCITNNEWMSKWCSLTLFEVYTVYVKKLGQFFFHTYLLSCLNNDRSVILKVESKGLNSSKNIIYMCPIPFNKLLLIKPLINFSYWFIYKKKTQHFTCFCITILFQSAKNYAVHYFIMKIPNKMELQQIALNYLSDVEFKDFMKLYKDYSRPFNEHFACRW